MTDTTGLTKQHKLQFIIEVHLLIVYSPLPYFWHILLPTTIGIAAPKLEIKYDCSDQAVPTMAQTATGTEHTPINKIHKFKSEASTGL